MTTYTPTDRSQSAGIPSVADDIISPADVALVTGSVPLVLTEDYIVAASQTILAKTPLGLDGSGRLVPAVYTTTPAIGISVVDITTDASTNYKGTPLYRAGCFNPLALVWPASYDTEAKKMAAFKQATAQPANIVLRRPKTATVS